MKTIKCFFVILASLFLGDVGANEVRIVNKFPQSIDITYVEKELHYWLSELEKVTKPNSNTFLVTFKQNPAFEKAGTFAFSCDRKNRIVFTAAEPIGILHALYTFCEELGITYDVTGASLPGKVDWTKVRGISREITPRVRWRGIRQHVNFPMDISSYPIEQATEYLKNLIRLRFNKLVVHSYPFQWYEDDVSSDTVTYGGSFFYGHKHNLEKSDFLKSIATLNSSVFCIPEAEAVYDHPAERSKVAITWMSQLLTEAKKLGLKVQFSFEPRKFTTEQGVKMAHKLIDTYPQIDDLELITEETGGWGTSCTDVEVRSTLETYFGKEVLSDTVITNRIASKQSDLAYLYHQIGSIVTIINTLEKDASFKAKVGSLKLGIYCSVGKYTYPAYYLARKSLPNHYITMMPSHGSKGTSDTFSSVIRSKEDLNKTELYSWIEFDGLMYQQQNAINGIGTLLEQMDQLSSAEQHHSLLFNHWRTAENRTTFRYASEVTLDKTENPNAFYTTYARRLGIEDAEVYGKAMNLVGEADCYSVSNLGNIGFCWVGAWRNGGSFTWMNPDKIDTCVSMYIKAGELIANLYKNSSAEPARNYLELLGNRILSSVLYLNAFKEATALRSIEKTKDGAVSEADRTRVVEICNHALLAFERYMKTYARIMPDRGSEGTIMSVWFSPMQGLRVLRNTLGGVSTDEIPHSESSLDAPPLPIFYEGL